MPAFTPPVVNDVPAINYEPGVDPLARRLFRHFGSNPRGRTVLKSPAGVYTTVDNPSQDQIDAAAVTYMGGHVYFVSVAEAAALTAAGYGAWIN